MELILRIKEDDSTHLLFCRATSLPRLAERRTTIRAAITVLLFIISFRFRDGGRLIAETLAHIRRRGVYNHAVNRLSLHWCETATFEDAWQLTGGLKRQIFVKIKTTEME